MTTLKNENYIVSEDKYIIGCDPYTDEMLEAFEMKYLTEDEIKLIETECKK